MPPQMAIIIYTGRLTKLGLLLLGITQSLLAQIQMNSVYLAHLCYMLRIIHLLTLIRLASALHCRIS